ncbi:MAG: filamentous hemagglutinin N-terminal domain-containing protein, partial [Azoarcus sp.]|nr:filamentous hemagglutinin N-terminal domain-containing protein [Azoarcus sp.]
MTEVLRGEAASFRAAPRPAPGGFLSPRGMRWTARLLIIALSLHPSLGLAQSIVAASVGTQLTQARNTVPVINLAAPNSKGVSHNQYQHYNIGKAGLILNNSNQAFTETQLGGLIQGNPQLQGKQTARLILNEVIGNHRSQLRGYTEIAGGAAHLVLANPHGITCDGCGFLNTPRVTLATGRPLLGPDGQLSHYRVTGGDILIEGQGIDAGGLDQFELLTRAARLNGELHARRLDIILGANQIDAQRLDALALESGGDIPQLAIDSSALGGMYAEVIRLVATEAGVGVHLSGEMAASAGDIQIDAAGALTLNRATARNALTLKAPAISLAGDVYAGGQGALATGGLLQITGSLSAGQGLALVAAQLDNTGRIETGLAPDGSLQSAPLQLTVARLLNSGEILARGGISGTGGDWTNTGILASNGTLDLLVQRLANSEGGFLYSEGDTRLLLDAFTNTEADVYVGGNLHIARDESGTTARAVHNRSGGLEIAGDVSIHAGAVTNERRVLDVETRKVSAKLTDTGCTGGTNCGGTNKNTSYTLQETDRTQILEASAPSWLIAGGTLEIIGATLENNASLIQIEGDLRVQADTFANRGVQVGDIITSRYLQSRLLESRKRMFRAAGQFNQQYSAENGKSGIEQAISTFLNDWIDPAYTQKLKTTFLPAADAAGYNGTILAGGDVTIHAKIIAESVLKPHYSLLTGGQTEDGGLGTQITVNTQQKADLSHKLTDPLSLPGAGRPSKRFRPAPADHPYLIETRPLFTGLATFLSSNHLLALLGLDPDQVQQRLGDGGYEQKLIRDALLARTGQRYLGEYSDDETQYLALMEDAAAEQKALQLVLGVELSAGQISALTHDIVWLVEKEIDGQKVLAPVLYLAQSGQYAPSGATLQGRNITLTASEHLHNDGAILATGQLSAIAQQITNTGLLQSDSALALQSTGDITNTGLILGGGDITLIAGGGILNQTSLTTHQAGSADGNRQQHVDIVGEIAAIHAANHLAFLAGGAILNLGGVLDAGGSLFLQSSGDILLSALSIEQSASTKGKHDNRIVRDIQPLGSDIRAGNNLLMDAGQNLLITASALQAGNDIILQAQGGLLIQSAASEHHDEYHKSHNGKKIDRIDNQIRQQASTLAAGGSLSLTSGGDMYLISSFLLSGDEMMLLAGGGLSLLAAYEQDYHYLYTKEKDFWSRIINRRLEHDQRAVGNRLEAGGNILLASGGA